MAEYNDEQLGAGGEDGGVAECPDPKHDRMLLQTAVDDFDKNFREE